MSNQSEIPLNQNGSGFLVTTPEPSQIFPFFRSSKWFRKCLQSKLPPCSITLSYARWKSEVLCIFYGNHLIFY